MDVPRVIRVADLSLSLISDSIDPLWSFISLQPRTAIAGGIELAKLWMLE